MTFLVGSDLHLRPGDEIPDFALKFFKLGRQVDIVVLNGDIFDFLPYGLKSWKTQDGQKTIQGFLKAVAQTRIVLVAGNHDPYSYLKRLYLPFKIYRRYRDSGWLFVHGHQHLDLFIWRYLPGIVEFMVEHFPNQWLWLMERSGWAGRRREKLTPKEQERFNMLISAFHSSWLREAERRNLSICVGHTHKLLVAKWLGNGPGFLVDCGDLRDGYCIKIDGEPEVVVL